MENLSRAVLPQSMNIDRTDPLYVEALVEKKPHIDDPKEIDITDKIRSEIFKEEWVRDAFGRIDSIQKQYLRNMVRNATNHQEVHDQTQKVLKEISEVVRSEIVEGEENLDKIPKGSPVLVATNHFGGYKLLPVNPKEELGVDIPGYDSMYPYPMYFAALNPVAEKLNDNLYYVSDDFPLVFGDIHRSADFINVPPAKVVPHGRTDLLEHQTAELIRHHPNAAIVNFPEGGTSGKYSGLGPYDLDKFQSGGYVIASHLRIPILPVGQYFDIKKGFRLRVFEPTIPEVKSREEHLKDAEKNKNEMQAWLDSRKNS